MEDEDKEVGNTQNDVGGVHDVYGKSVAPFDGDAEKEQTLQVKRRWLEFASMVLCVVLNFAYN